MADVVSKTSPTAGAKLSVNTPDFPTSDWLVNPTIGGVPVRDTTVPAKYWKVSGETLLEMTASEKAIVDAQEVADVPPVSASSSATAQSSGIKYTTYLELDRNTNAKHHLNGDYQVTWTIEIANAGKAGLVRLRDKAGAVVLDGPYRIKGTDTDSPVLVSRTVSLRGESGMGRHFLVQYRDRSGEHDQVVTAGTIDVQLIS